MTDLGTDILQIVTDSEKVNQINERLHQAIFSELSTGLNSSLYLVKIANWIAVPMLEFPSDSVLFSQAENSSVENSCKDLIAVILPQYNHSGFVYEVLPTENWIEEFKSAMSPFCTVLFSSKLEPSWFLLSIESDYYIAIGSLETIGNLFKCSPVAVFSSFHAFINNLRNSDPPSHLYDRYFTFIYDQLVRYRNADVGTRISLTLL